MDPDPWLYSAVVLVILLLLALALLSSLETAVLSARRSRLAHLQPSPAVQRAEAVLEDPNQFQSSAHLAKSFCEAAIYPAAAIAGLDLALRVAGPQAVASGPFSLLTLAWPGLLLGPLLAYFCVVLLGEVLPKAVATRHPEQTLLRWSGFIRTFTLAFTPFHWLARQAAQALTLPIGVAPHLATRAAHSEEEIKLLVEDSAEEGVLEEDEKEMIQSIFEFTDTIARQIMVPRIDIHSAREEASLDELVGVALESGHSRIPVYRDTLDRVVGIVHVKDLLPYLVKGKLNTPIRTLMREPFFVPEGKKIDELLQEFRSHKSQLAIVVDEYGGTSGLVTIEDVLEEIVGEIEDEYDVEEQPGAEVLAAGEGALIDARMSVDDVNESLGFDLPQGDYDTLGGFVFSLFGRPPSVGDAVSHNGYEFVVEATEGLRILKVRVLLHPNEDEPAAPDAASFSVSEPS